MIDEHCIITENDLQDESGKNLSAQWREHKIKDRVLIEAYTALHMCSKAARVAKCGTYLAFRFFLETGHRSLHAANFCKIRLCPMCAWRRSKKVYEQCAKVMTAAEQKGKIKFLFLTLTIRNCSARDLDATLDQLLKGFYLLYHRKDFKKVVRGWFRTLEITHNWEKKTYHPHIHAVLAVSDDYGQYGKGYLSFEWWRSVWQECLDVDYAPMVRIERVKPRKGCVLDDGAVDDGAADDAGGGRSRTGIVREVTKYVTKEADYTAPKRLGEKEGKKATKEAVFVLDVALSGRRLVAFGGILRELHKQLNLDDIDDGDLLDEVSSTDLAYVIEHYHWSLGVLDYKLFSVTLPPVPRVSGGDPL